MKSAIIIITVAVATSIANPVNNIIWLGWGASNEGFGFSAKYLHKIESVYAGIEFKIEEELEIFSSSNVQEGKVTLKIPLAAMFVERYYFAGVETGISLSNFTRHGRLVSSNCGFLSCDNEYDVVRKHGIGLPIELSAGLRHKIVGISASAGYELNSFSSTPYYLVKIWFGY